MMYILAKDEPLMFVMLTEQDVQTMRPGRTVFLDLAQSAVKQFSVRKVVLSLHKNDKAIRDVLQQAGHGWALQENLIGQPPKPEGDEITCAGCGGINKPYMLHLGKCIVCWYKAAMQNISEQN